MRRSSWVRCLLGVLVLLLLGLSAHPSADASTVLRQGAKGREVIVLQQRLTDLRYDVGKVDGVFGPSTHHAVVAFQKVNGLARDGIVGARTRAALSKPRALAPAQVRTGTYVEVDVGRQVLKVLSDGTVVRIHDVSTGKAATSTPIGRFRVERRIDGWRTSRLGTMWRPAYFSGGYAIHGSSSVPPYPASHGCVRLTNASMNRLWTSLPVGTPVQIHR
jgi:peptidoglycan hydrolase-like protein with peptidoglycan-binding domain